MYFDPINPPKFFLDHPTSLHTHLCVPVFFPTKAILCCSNILGYVAFPWSMAHILSVALLKKAGTRAGEGFHIQLPSPCQALVWLVSAVTSTGRSCVQLPWSIQKTPTPCKHPRPLYYTFSAPSSAMAPEPWEEGCSICSI